MVDFLHQLQFFLFQSLQLLLVLLFLLADFDDSLSLFGVYACQFFFPVLHILLFGLLRLLCNFPFLFSLHSEKFALHLFQPFRMLHRYVFNFPRVIQLDQINSLLNILQLLFVAHSQLLIPSAKLLSFFLLLAVIFLFLHRLSSYPLVDLVDFNLFLNYVLGELPMFLHVVFLLLQLLPQQFHSVFHGLNVSVQFLELVLLVYDRQLGVYSSCFCHLLCLIY